MGELGYRSPLSLRLRLGVASLPRRNRMVCTDARLVIAHPLLFPHIGPWMRAFRAVRPAVISTLTLPRSLLFSLIVRGLFIQPPRILLLPLLFLTSTSLGLAFFSTRPKAVGALAALRDNDPAQPTRTGTT